MECWAHSCESRECLYLYVTFLAWVRHAMSSWMFISSRSSVANFSSKLAGIILCMHNHWYLYQTWPCQEPACGSVTVNLTCKLFTGFILKKRENNQSYPLFWYERTTLILFHAHSFLPNQLYYSDTWFTMVLAQSYLDWFTRYYQGITRL